MVKGFLTVQYHFDQGADSEFDDPASWTKASYLAHPVDSIEPICDEPNPYRQAAIFHMRLMFTIDRFIETTEDARLAVVAVAFVMQWPSVRGLSISNIADQLGCSPATLTRSIARFKTLAGLAGGGVRFIRPGAGSNGDKPAAVQA
jgi:Homeodomain-like domain